MTRLASRNLRSLDLSNETQQVLDIGLDALAIGTAWARTEAGAHFPSDTLFSIALGNFVASFVNDAFLGIREDPHIGVTVVATADGAAFRWQFRF